jgi:hypothetical protein
MPASELHTVLMCCLAGYPCSPPVMSNTPESLGPALTSSGSHAAVMGIIPIVAVAALAALVRRPNHPTSRLFLSFCFF